MDLIAEAMEFLVMESFNPNEYTATFEKSSFGGYRAKVVRKSASSKEAPMYLGSSGYKTIELATGEAQEYMNGYYQAGPDKADRLVSAYRQRNQNNIVSK